MKKRYFFIVIGISALLLILGSFFDFQISSALYWKDNPISIIFAMIMEYPAFGALAFASGIILVLNKKFIKNGFLNFCFYVGAGIYLLVAGYFFGDALCASNALGFFIPVLEKVFISFPLGLLLVSPMTYVGFKVGKIITSKQIFWSIVVTSFGIVLIFTVCFVLKELIARPRFWYINDIAHVSFCNWWEPFENKDYFIKLDELDNNTFNSLPSGHAAYSATLMMILPLLPLYFDNLKGKKTLLFFVGFGVALLTGFTRIICGMHFLSDVAISLLISSISAFIVYIICANYVAKRINKE